MNQHAIGYGYNRAAMTVEEFCEEHRIGRTTYYRLEKEGTAPRSIKIGRRRIITSEAAAEWRSTMEAAEARS